MSFESQRLHQLGGERVRLNTSIEIPVGLDPGSQSNFSLYRSAIIYTRFGRIWRTQNTERNKSYTIGI